MNPILKQAFANGVMRYYPYEIGNRLIISVYRSYVLYYLENEKDSTEISIIELCPQGLASFKFKNNLLRLSYSLPYNTK